MWTTYPDLLCKNRTEGFSVSSNYSSHLPTTCFTDVILIPLPTWIAIFLLPILLTVAVRLRDDNDFDPSTAHLRTKRQDTCIFTTTLLLYYIWLVGNIAMLTLEIVRLSLLKAGIGLLPFAYCGLILGCVLFSTQGLKNRVRYWQIINMVVWLGGLAVSVVQLLGLIQIHEPSGRKGSKYPVDDQILDVSVMMGLYFALAAFEIGLGIWRVQRKKTDESQETRSPGTELTTMRRGSSQDRVIDEDEEKPEVPKISAAPGTF